MSIHPWAIVSPKAEIGEEVSIGPFSIVEEEVRIGAKTEVGSHVLMQSGTIIGENCSIHHGAVVGSIPQDLKFHDERTTLEIGDGTTIREYVTVNRGTVISGRTVIGRNCLLMAYVHVAHDCQIGDHVILTNCTSLAGHVTIGDYADLGGLVGVHQFTKIGCHSFIGGGSRVFQDVPPYIKAAGEPLRAVGLNIGRGFAGPVGLEKHGLSKESIETLKKAYRILFRLGLNTSQAIARVRQEAEQSPEVRTLIEFIEQSKRGIVK